MSDGLGGSVADGVPMTTLMNQSELPGGNRFKICDLSALAVAWTVTHARPMASHKLKMLNEMPSTSSDVIPHQLTDEQMQMKQAEWIAHHRDQGHHPEHSPTVENPDLVSVTVTGYGAS